MRSIEEMIKAYAKENQNKDDAQRTIQRAMIDKRNAELSAEALLSDIKQAMRVIRDGADKVSKAVKVDEARVCLVTLKGNDELDIEVHTLS